MTVRVSPASARRLLHGRPLPAPRVCVSLKRGPVARSPLGLIRKVTSLCNVRDDAREIFKDTYELNTNDRELVTARRRSR